MRETHHHRELTPVARQFEGRPHLAREFYDAGGNFYSIDYLTTDELYGVQVILERILLEHIWKMTGIKVKERLDKADEGWVYGAREPDGDLLSTEEAQRIIVLSGKMGIDLWTKREIYNPTYLRCSDPFASYYHILDYAVPLSDVTDFVGINMVSFNGTLIHPTEDLKPWLSPRMIFPSVEEARKYSEDLVGRLNARISTYL